MSPTSPTKTARQTAPQASRSKWRRAAKIKLGTRAPRRPHYRAQRGPPGDFAARRPQITPIGQRARRVRGPRPRLAWPRDNNGRDLFAQPSHQVDDEHNDDDDDDNDGH